MEAILTDFLLQNHGIAKGAKNAPKDKETALVKYIKDCGLVSLVSVATELGRINPGFERLSHLLREYRDLSHLSVEIRTRLKSDREETRISLEILNMLHRDLLQ